MLYHITMKHKTKQRKIKNSYENLCKILMTDSVPTAGEDVHNLVAQLLLQLMLQPLLPVFNLPLQ
jgi:hypothetical protein